MTHVDNYPQLLNEIEQASGAPCATDKMHHKARAPQYANNFAHAWGQFHHMLKYDK